MVRKALSGVARAKQRAGVLAVAEMLVGQKTARAERFGFTHLTTFGLLASHPHESVAALLRGLLAAGWVDLTTTEHPVPFLTPLGWNVMSAKAPARFRLPPLRRTRKAGKGSTGAVVKSTPGGDVPELALHADDRALLDALRAWRNGVAKEKGYAPYVIALDRSLQELALRRPQRVEDLPGIHGLGPARIEAWGAQLVALVAQHTGNRTPLAAAPRNRAR